ncbi:MAG: hypothetical protein LBT45_01215 [Rickettsiales bacterium]|jgi:hypothetical protein|nr:hypothetical protein [Rickettsiales bacterium]
MKKIEKTKLYAKNKYGDKIDALLAARKNTNGDGVYFPTADALIDEFVKFPKIKKYLDRALEYYARGEIVSEDLGVLNDNFAEFESRKHQLEIKDISGYPTVYDLRRAINGTKRGMSMHQLRKIAKDEGAYKIFENDKLLAVVTETYEANCLYGANTHWCTTSKRGSETFDEYNKQGPLIVLIDKTGTGKKYQFHFATSQFMDELDSHVDIVDFLYDKPQKLRRSIVDICCCEYSSDWDVCYEFVLNEDDFRYELILNKKLKSSDLYAFEDVEIVDSIEYFQCYSAYMNSGVMRRLFPYGKKLDGRIHVNGMKYKDLLYSALSKIVKGYGRCRMPTPAEKKTLLRYINHPILSASEKLNMLGAMKENGFLDIPKQIFDGLTEEVVLEMGNPEISAKKRLQSLHAMGYDGLQYVPYKVFVRLENEVVFTRMYGNPLNMFRGGYLCRVGGFLKNFKDSRILVDAVKISEYDGVMLKTVQDIAKRVHLDYLNNGRFTITELTADEKTAIFSRTKTLVKNAVNSFQQKVK